MSRRGWRGVLDRLAGRADPRPLRGQRSPGLAQTPAVQADGAVPVPSGVQAPGGAAPDGVQAPGDHPRAGQISPSSLDRALERLREQIPARDDGSASGTGRP